MAYGDYRYEVKAYYDGNLRGLADDFYTDDKSEAYANAYEFVGNGHVVEITDTETGESEILEYDDVFYENKNNGSMKLNLCEDKYGINDNARYRFYDVFKNDGSSVNIAFSDEIDPAYFREVVGFGIDMAIKSLGIPFDTERFSRYIDIFRVEEYEETFKVNWDFEYSINAFGKRIVTASWVRVTYSKENETLDASNIYDIETYEQALDFIMDYVQDILNNGVKEDEPPKYDEQLLNNIKLMHNVMTSMNNEDAYYSWIYVCPDEPSEDDFIYIASNEDEYKDCEDTFYSLFKKYAKDGLYRPTEEEKQFAFDTCNKLGIPQIEVLD